MLNSGRGKMDWCAGRNNATGNTYIYIRRWSSPGPRFARLIRTPRTLLTACIRPGSDGFLWMRPRLSPPGVRPRFAGPLSNPATDESLWVAPSVEQEVLSSPGFDTDCTPAIQRRVQPPVRTFSTNFTTSVPAVRPSIQSEACSIALSVPGQTLHNRPSVISSRPRTGKRCHLPRYIYYFL